MMRSRKTNCADWQCARPRGDRQVWTKRIRQAAFGQRAFADRAGGRRAGSCSRPEQRKRTLGQHAQDPRHRGRQQHRIPRAPALGGAAEPRSSAAASRRLGARPQLAGRSQIRRRAPQGRPEFTISTSSRFRSAPRSPASPARPIRRAAPTRLPPFRRASRRLRAAFSASSSAVATGRPPPSRWCRRARA